MRDLALIAILVTFLPMAFRFPIVGLLLWEWLAFMNPHRMVYGFAAGAQLNLIVAALTIPLWLFSPRRSKFRLDTTGVLLLLFSIWMCITTFMAPNFAVSEPLLERNLKTMLLLFLVLAMTDTPARIAGTIWIIVLSIGYYGDRGAVFMAATGGNYIVMGPPETMMGDNNGFGCALNLVLPLINFLRVQTRSRLMKLGLLGSMLGCALSILGTYSRGALMTLGSMLAFLWFKSRTKLLTFALAAVVGGVVLVAMPAKYHDRISTISQAGEDESFMGRVDAWIVATDVALHRPFGAGFDGPRQLEVWNQYRPEATARASHSIYFMVLGEQGFIGFALYIAILATAWINLRRIIQTVRDRPEMLWVGDLAQAMQVSMVGFCLGGALLPMAYYDGFLVLITLTSVLRRLVESHVQGEELSEIGGASWSSEQERFAQPAGAAQRSALGYQSRFE